MRRDRRLANLRQLRRISPRVEVTVDEFVLHGFQPSERYTIGDAFQLELERLFSGAGLGPAFRRDAELPRLETGQVSLPDRARPASVGAQVARAVHGALTK
jgi:hypothetical protein